MLSLLYFFLKTKRLLQIIRVQQYCLFKSAVWDPESTFSFIFSTVKIFHQSSKPQTTAASFETNLNFTAYASKTEYMFYTYKSVEHL